VQFLIVGRVKAETKIEQVLPVVKPEAAKVWELYASDRLRSIHYIADKSGAVLLCEANNVEEINAMIAQLPMAQAGVMQFEVIPLLPYTGTAELFAQ
jgi:muconolactone delta-isomerase